MVNFVGFVVFVVMTFLRETVEEFFGVLALLEDLIGQFLELRRVVLKVPDVCSTDMVVILLAMVVAGFGEAGRAPDDRHVEGDEVGKYVVLGR